VHVLLAALAMTLPQHGVLAPGRSLAGVRLNDPIAAVTRRLGPTHDICGVCDEQTWLFHYRGVPNEGVAVVLRRNRVAAIFTLGAPRGWRTTEGLRLGEPLARVVEVYGRSLPRTACVGYLALSMRTHAAVTSIYMTGDAVYGFALTLPSTPVCR
jgi:hypothetical protein